MLELAMPTSNYLSITLHHEEQYRVHSAAVIFHNEFGIVKVDVLWAIHSCGIDLFSPSLGSMSRCPILLPDTLPYNRAVHSISTSVLKGRVLTATHLFSICQHIMYLDAFAPRTCFLRGSCFRCALGMT